MKKLLVGLLALGSLSSFANQDIYSELEKIDGKSIFELERDSRDLIRDCGRQIFDDVEPMKKSKLVPGGNKLEVGLPTEEDVFFHSRSYGLNWDNLKVIFDKDNSPKYYKAKWKVRAESNESAPYSAEITRIYDKNCKYMQPLQEENLDFAKIDS